MNKVIAWITGLLTLLLAFFSFVLSFNALTDLAAKHGVSIPPLFPFVVEFAVVIFSLNALHRSMTGQKAWWQWTLIILSSLLAGTFNIAHANSDILSRAMSAMPSLFLLLSFESFLSLVKYSVTRQTAIVTLDKLQAEIEDKTAKTHNLDDRIDKLVGQIQELEMKRRQAENMTNADNPANSPAFVKGDLSALNRANEVKLSKVAERRQEVLSLLGEGLSADDIAERLAVSARTIKRDITSLNGQVRVTA